jgi:hypothetical protein
MEEQSVTTGRGWILRYQKCNCYRKLLREVENTFPFMNGSNLNYKIWCFHPRLWWLKQHVAPKRWYRLQDYTLSQSRRSQFKNQHRETSNLCGVFINVCNFLLIASEPADLKAFLLFPTIVWWLKSHFKWHLTTSAIMFIYERVFPHFALRRVTRQDKRKLLKQTGSVTVLVPSDRIGFYVESSLSVPTQPSLKLHWCEIWSLGQFDLLENN